MGHMETMLKLINNLGRLGLDQSILIRSSELYDRIVLEQALYSCFFYDLENSSTLEIRGAGPSVRIEREVVD